LNSPRTENGHHLIAMKERRSRGSIILPFYLAVI
jgi:hypothetical protein